MQFTEVMQQYTEYVIGLKISNPRFQAGFQDFKQDFGISSKISGFLIRFQLKCTRFRASCKPLDTSSLDDRNGPSTSAMSDSKSITLNDSGL